MTENSSKIILALDIEDRDELCSITSQLKGHLSWVKIGLQQFCKYGPEIVHHFAGEGFKVFLDLKLHDIPNTVASAIKSLSNLPIEMLTIHSCGGREMMERAGESANANFDNLQLLAVTVLTSLNDAGIQEVGVPSSAKDQVRNLANLTISSGIDGLVCSPLEVEVLRQEIGSKPVLVTPGIRPAGSDSQEQKRIMTPSEAIEKGSSYLVIGRPILKAANPVDAFHAIADELK